MRVKVYVYVYVCVCVRAHVWLCVYIRARVHAFMQDTSEAKTIVRPQLKGNNPVLLARATPIARGRHTYTPRPDGRQHACRWIGALTVWHASHKH